MRCSGQHTECSAFQARRKLCHRRWQHAQASHFTRHVPSRAQFGSGDVAVVGGGIMGLTTALMIKQQFPAASVDLIAEKGYSESTSHGAAGLWEPYAIVCTPDEDINRWGQSTYDRFDNLRCSAEGARAGVQFVTCHNLSLQAPTASEDIPAWSHIAHNFTSHSFHSGNTSSTSVQQSVDGNGASCGQKNLLSYGTKLSLLQEFGTYIVDQSYYLPYIAEQVHALGVQQYSQKVESFDELAECGYKCVFNCAGLGARELAADEDLVPVRGQVRRVRAPWIKHAMFLDGTYYILPNVDSIVVGGTTQQGDERTEVDWDDRARIWENILHMCPSLATAETVTDWVGLRPLRTSGVRLERDDVSVSTGVPVIHNYGHGGSGITLHWGCAEEAVSLARQELLTLSGESRSSAPVDT